MSIRLIIFHLYLMVELFFANDVLEVIFVKF